MLINHYKASPWYKSLIKDAVFVLRYLWLYVRNGFRSRTVLFYPEFPVFRSRINRYLRNSRFNITNNPNLPFDLVVAWEDVTHRPRYPLLTRLARDYRVVNLHCDDISKRKVEAVSQAVFGYGLCIDPTQFVGPCVRKSDTNGSHDKTAIVQCPINKKDVDPDCVYQQLVDNRYSENLVTDIRIQVCGEQLATVFLRFKTLDRRFSDNLREEVHDIDQHLSVQEISQVRALARRMGLDYGEIDALRDHKNGRLYVVDVNNTPWQAAADVDIPPEHVRRYMRRGRRALNKAFLEPAITRRRAQLKPSQG